MNVSELWEEAREPGENLHRQRENVQTPHRKGQNFYLFIYFLNLVLSWNPRYCHIPEVVKLSFTITSRTEVAWTEWELKNSDVSTWPSWLWNARNISSGCKTMYLQLDQLCNTCSRAQSESRQASVFLLPQVSSKLNIKLRRLSLHSDVRTSVPKVQLLLQLERLHCEKKDEHLGWT